MILSCANTPQNWLVWHRMPFQHEGSRELRGSCWQQKSIPIIFANVTDPVGQGLVASLARPGGNATGFTAFEFSMGSKWVEIRGRAIVRHIGLLFNPAMAPFSNYIFKRYGPPLKPLRSIRIQSRSQTTRK